ncbi:MAG: hypothetical protein JO061_22635 [Acidobacteriaceae bacterium]|nr:hypothetical protein [Acidobacteriaceae bacterium]
MNCYLHPTTPAVAYCRGCGRGLCSECQRPAEGTVFCPEHVPVSAYTPPPPPDPVAPNPYVQPPPVPGVHTSPGLAFLCGLIPGVGAIYNTQYVKGLTHALIFGALISLTDAAGNSAGQGLIAMVLAAFYFYMPFEAYHTARKRQLGLPIDEWSAFFDPNRAPARAPIGPIVLILVGVLFLLDSLHVVPFRELGRFWPIILIIIGAVMLYSRLGGGSRLALRNRDARDSSGIVETFHERR